MNKDSRCAALEDIHHILICNLSLTLHDNFVTLDRYYLTCILINEVLIPALKYTCSKLAAHNSLQSLLVDLNLLSEVEDLKDVFISFKSDGT